jgi:enoyl-CoA hydratase/carnithine racemase
MMQLPQTIVIDLGDGAETLASEFALGADIRIASEEANIKFNHCHYGLVPAAGGMSMLSTLVAPAFARNWILSGSSINHNVLSESGFLSQSYNKETRSEMVRELLTDISKVAPVQRIQAKLGLFEALRSSFESGIVMDRKVVKASMVSEDWRTKRPEEKDFNFMPAKSMSYAVKLSLIKSDDAPRNLDH